MDTSSRAATRKKEARKTALRVYNNIFGNFSNLSVSLLELPNKYKEEFEEALGESGLILQLKDHFKTLITTPAPPRAPINQDTNVDELVPEDTEATNEVEVGGEEPMQEVPVDVE
jgi:hypothetical protein